MGELTITCCEFCQKWFNVENIGVEAYDYKNENHMSFCPTCGEKLVEHINKMKKEIYGHKEENNGNQTQR